jgi:hypothetical protein
MMRQVMWDEIDGDTVWTTLDGVAAVLPAAARVRVADVEAIVADYALWKRLVRQRQLK